MYGMSAPSTRRSDQYPDPNLKVWKAEPFHEPSLGSPALFISALFTSNLIDTPSKILSIILCYKEKNMDEGPSF